MEQRKRTSAKEHLAELANREMCSRKELELFENKSQTKCCPPRYTNRLLYNMAQIADGIKNEETFGEALRRANRLKNYQRVMYDKLRPYKTKETYYLMTFKYVVEGYENAKKVLWKNHEKTGQNQ